MGRSCTLKGWPNPSRIVRTKGARFRPFYEDRSAWPQMILFGQARLIILQPRDRERDRWSSGGAAEIPVSRRERPPLSWYRKQRLLHRVGSKLLVSAHREASLRLRPRPSPQVSPAALEVSPFGLAKRRMLAPPLSSSSAGLRSCSRPVGVDSSSLATQGLVGFVHPLQQAMGGGG